jgi:hypothetical protein
VTFDRYRPISLISQEITGFGARPRMTENGLSLYGTGSSTVHSKGAGIPGTHKGPRHDSNGRSPELARTVHRLRNPATGIFSAAECLIEGDCGCLTEKQSSLLQGIMDSASAILNILEEMTDKNPQAS